MKTKLRPNTAYIVEAVLVDDEAGRRVPIEVFSTRAEAVECARLLTADPPNDHAKQFVVRQKPL